MNNQERATIIYNDAYEYLLNNTDGLTREMLDTYLICPRLESLDEVFFLVINSVQDMFKVKKRVLLYDGNFDRIKKTLHNGDLSYFLKTYRKNPEGSDKLFDTLYEKLKFNNPDSDFTIKVLRIYVSVLCGLADYLSQFKEIHAMYACFDGYQSCDEKIKLIKSVQNASKQVDYKEVNEGWGFALAANWLKDVGMESYCKPDTHVTNFVKGMQFVTAKSPENTTVFRTFVTFMEEANKTNKSITVFKADRLVYLIGSGDFYSHADKVKYHGSMDDFIAQELPKMK